MKKIEKGKKEEEEEEEIHGGGSRVFQRRLALSREPPLFQLGSPSENPLDERLKAPGTKIAG